MVAPCRGCPTSPPGIPTPQLPAGKCAEHPQYQAGCRPCQNASAARHRAVTRAKAYGRHVPADVPASTVRDHLQHLRDTHRMTLRQVAEVAQVAHASVSRAASGQTEQIRAVTAARILAVRPAPAKPGHFVPCLGTARRLRALAAIGYGPRELGPMLDEPAAEVARLRRLHRDQVHARRAAAIAALYGRLEGTHGPSDRARAEARLRDWAPPLAWDDETHLDDPARTVSYTADDLSARMVQRACAGEVPAAALNEQERRAAVAHLLRAGLTKRQIGDRLSWSGGGRAGRVAVAAYLRTNGHLLASVPQRARPAADRCVDRVAIERALTGERIRLSRLERHHAVHARGRMPLQQAADLLRLSYSRAKDLAAAPPPVADIAA